MREKLWQSECKKVGGRTVGGGRAPYVLTHCLNIPPRKSEYNARHVFGLGLIGGAVLPRWPQVAHTCSLAVVRMEQLLLRRDGRPTRWCGVGERCPWRIRPVPSQWSDTTRRPEGSPLLAALVREGLYTCVGLCGYACHPASSPTSVEDFTPPVPTNRRVYTFSEGETPMVPASSLPTLTDL